MCLHVLLRTCVIAKPLSLLPPPVEPDAEAHQNDPAGPADARDEGRLFHHIRDLLSDAVIPAHDHIPEVFTYITTHTHAHTGENQKVWLSFYIRLIA